MSSRRRVAELTPTPTEAPERVSETLVHACAGFGVLPVPAQTHAPRATAIDAGMLTRLTACRVVLVTGASGSGKSSLLRGIDQALSDRRGMRALRVSESFTPAQSRRAGFDLLSGSASTRARVMAQAGLAEPRLWSRPAGVLSAGEGARLRLAMTMQHARRGDVVLCDELASGLDRVSAYALCATLRRWAQRAGVTLVAASAHEDLEGMLGPDLVIDAGAGVCRAPCARIEQAVRIERGTMADYRALAHLHYRSGTPASVVRVLRAVRDTPTGELLAGVLVVSMPTLNALWRARAWPGRYDRGDKTERAHRLNRELRVISRVIVEPRSRGLGVATRLVRAYLDEPLTPGTEAVAAMGSVCPFFARAGMRAYTLAPDAADTRLLDALAHLALSPASLLRVRVEPGSLLARELTSWGRRRKLLNTGRVGIDKVRRLTPLAACRLCSRPRAYAFVKGETDERASDEERAE